MKDKLKMYIINEADKEDVYIHKGWMHFFTYHLDGEYSDQETPSKFEYNEGNLKNDNESI